MGNLSVLGELVNKHGYSKFESLINNNLNNILNERDCKFAGTIHGSLYLGFCKRFQVMVFSLFGADMKIARIVAQVVSPYLSGLRPAEAPKPKRLKKPIDPSSESRVHGKSLKATIGNTRVSSSIPPSTTVQTSSTSGFKSQTKKGAPLPLVFDGEQIHRIGWGHTVYDVQDPKDLVGLFQGFIQPGVRGGIDSTIQIDGKKVVISSDPILKAAYEEADRLKKKDREAVHREQGAYGQHASVVLSSQIAEAAKKRNARRVVIE